jgi:hypothetical protein
MQSKEDEQPSWSVLLCQPFLDKIIRKTPFGKPYARAIDLIDVGERLYSIGAALGHGLQNKLDILAKLLVVPGAKEYEADRIMSLCKKDARMNLKRFINEFGREPDNFGDFWSYRHVENRLRNEGISLSAEDAIEAYARGDRRIKKIFDEKIGLEGIEQIMMPPLLQGIHFGSSFPELTEKMYRKAYEEDRDFWASKWRGVTIPEDFKVMSLEETQRAVLQMVAAYTSQYYPELLDSLGLRDYIDVVGSR